MYFKWLKKVGAGVLAIALIFGAQAVTCATEATDNIEIILTDITEDDQTTLLGEAKIKVSVKGAAGKASAVQTALKFSGDLKYKSIDFLQGENNPPTCVFVPPNAALANLTGTILPGIITDNSGALNFTDAVTDLFVITFAGEAGEKITLSLNNESAAGSYVKLGNSFTETAEDAIASVTASASNRDNKGVKAVVKLTMDKIDDFQISNEDGYADSKILLTITKEGTEKGSTISTVLNAVSNTKGGHYDSSSSVPTFIVENTVVDGFTYTVEIIGNGYVTYEKSGVDFSDVTALELTNADFVPGDVNHDGKVDAEDKKAFEEIKSGEYDDRADFNRDGKVDKYDDIFEEIESEKDEGENSDDSGSNSDKDNDGDSGSDSGSDGGSDGGKDNDKDSGKDSENSGKGGTGGAAGGVGGGVAAGGSATAEAFTDLAGYDWAKEAIYTLKNKGVISGISATEYAPANNIKRGDFILILTRMLGISDAFDENFADVPQGSYYYNAIGSAKAAGIATGDGQSFMPENTITRQDLITLAYRAFLAKGYITEADDMTSLDAFADKGIISDYALSPMASMVKAGIIRGSDGNVNPLGFATRAEVAVMCARLLNLMN